MLLHRIHLVLFIIELYFILCSGKSACFIESNLKRISGRSTNYDNGSIICEYTNIPYAWKPKRFEPAKLMPIEEIFNRLFKNAPKKCIQAIDYFVSGQENCLYLHIYSLWSENVTRPLQPVFVYLHGGTFNTGTAQEEINNFEEFLLEGIIFVTLNYRLGLFGFSSIANEGIEPNLGFKDQQLALKWIQDYIYNFGGDPKQITLAGWSAGAAAATYHLYSEGSKNLFSKAILISGSFLNPWAFNIETERCTLKFCEDLKIQNCSKLALRRQTTRKLMAQYLLNSHFDHFGIQFPCFLPSIDVNGSSISEPPHLLLSKKPVNDVPVLMGYTSLEDNCDVQWGNEYSMNNYTFPSNNKKIFEIFENISIILRAKETKQNVDSLRRMADMHHGIFKFADVYSGYSKNPLYLYRFAPAHDDGQLCFSVEKGALHGDDMRFIFWKVEPPFSKRSVKLRLELIELWINFIKYGYPSPKEYTTTLSEPWKPYERVNRTILNIGGKLTIRKQKFSKFYLFWDVFYDCAMFERCDSLTKQMEKYK